MHQCRPSHEVSKGKKPRLVARGTLITGTQEINYELPHLKKNRTFDSCLHEDFELIAPTAILKNQEEQ